MPPKKRQPKREAGAKQIVNVSVKVGGDAKKPKRKRAKRAVKKIKESGDIAQPGATGVEYLGVKTLPPPSYPLLPPATYELPKQFQALPPPPQLAGLIEDVKRERSNLLEDIQREVKSTAIKEVQRAQGAEQRAELERAGFQEPVPLPKLLDKAQEPIQTFDEIIRGGQVLPFEDESFLESEFKAPKEQVEEFPTSSRVKELLPSGRKKGSKNRSKEEIQAEKQAKEEAKLQKAMKKALETRGKKSKIPQLDIEQQRIIPIKTQREFNLLPSNLATMPTGLPF